MPAFRFSRRAEADLLSIADYTLANGAKPKPPFTLASFEVCCQALADNPALGRLCDDVRPGLRRHEHGKHVVFYRQDVGASSFLASCISACCPIDTPLTIKT